MNRSCVMPVLRGYQLWDVEIGNNYFNGRYPNFSYRRYPVIAVDSNQARRIVLEHSNEILKDLKSKQYNSHRRLLPQTAALPITDSLVGSVTPAIPRTTGKHCWRKTITPEGWAFVQFEESRIVNWKEVEHETGNP